MASKLKARKKRSALPVFLTAALFLALFYVVVFLRGPQPALPTDPTESSTPTPAESTPEPTPEPTPENPADLRLSELMAKNHSALRAPDGSFPDWIELYNADSEPVLLEGWRLSDKESGGWALPALTLQPGEYLLVYADGSGRMEDGLLCADFSLSPDETVYLFSPGGTLVDQMACGTEVANHSMARDESGELFETKDPTPGLPNTKAGAEIYAASLDPLGPLSINEVVVSNFSTLAQGGKYYDWVELKNISEAALLLSDYYLSDDEDEPLLWRLPELTLEPGQSYVVFCSGDESLSNGSNLHTNFKLDAAEEDLFLSDANGRAVDYVYLRNIPTGGSMGRLPGENGWFYFLSASPNADNGPLSVYIDKSCLLAGAPLRLYNPLGYTLRFFLDDEELPGEAPVLGEADYEKWITVRAYQGDRLVSEDRAYFSRLPVLYIDTKGAVSIQSKTVYRSGTMTIQSNAETAGSDYEYSGAIQIRGRGNTSWRWPKKPYRIKLDDRADLFGMGENKNWVLLANYLDESLLRNVTGTQLSAELGLVSMDSVWTDVILNGEYIGNYQLCEQIRIDESRIDIFDWEREAKQLAAAVCEQVGLQGRTLDVSALSAALKQDLSWVTQGSFRYLGRSYSVRDYYELPEDLSGGYLFELSKEFDEPSEFRTNASLTVMVKSPGALRSNADMMTYVRQYWQDFENAYRAEDGYAETAEGRKHYTELADLDSIIAFWLSNEIVGNGDAFYKSRYAYLDRNERLRFGPVWDFDWGCGSSAVVNSGGWQLANREGEQAFYREFLDDPLFVVKATEAYWGVRPYLDRLLEDGGLLDAEIAYLRESGLADQARWDRRATWPADARGFERDTQLFKQYLRERVTWLDTQFADDAILLAATRSSLSAFPYERAADLLRFELAGAEADSISAHAPAEFAVRHGEDISVSVRVAEPAAVSLEVYVNGLHACTLPVREGSASFSVSAGQLQPEFGEKSVISVIAKDAGGATCCRNFTTVISYS